MQFNFISIAVFGNDMQLSAEVKGKYSQLGDVFVVVKQ